MLAGFVVVIFVSLASVMAALTTVSEDGTLDFTAPNWDVSFFAAVAGSAAFVGTRAARAVADLLSRCVPPTTV